MEKLARVHRALGALGPAAEAAEVARRIADEVDDAALHAALEGALP